ncbi:MAG: phosphoribosyl-AMP cyclohydrolase [Spirochaetaceae bacterium]
MDVSSDERDKTVLPDADKLIERIDFDKTGGLVPVVVQEAAHREVLMLAYADREAVRLTAHTGFAHYFSRSRKSIWKKGETSGNLQKIVEIRVDCDEDTLLYIVRQRGAACHTGRYSCFYRRADASGLTEIPESHRVL